MVMQVQYRWASSGWAPAPSTRCHEGCAAVPLAVRNTMPLAWPTQTASESPGATASAPMLEPALGLIADHRGPEVSVLGCLASSVRHSDSPPASMRFGSLGTSTNGAMNSARWFIASSRRNGTGFQAHSPIAGFQNWTLMSRPPWVSSLVPPSVLRWMLRNTYSP